MPYFENIVSALDAPRNAANPVKIQRKFLNFILKSVPCLVNYNKNRFVIKDKKTQTEKTVQKVVTVGLVVGQAGLCKIVCSLRGIVLTLWGLFVGCLLGLHR